MSNNYEFPILSINREEYDAMQRWIKSNKKRIKENRVNLYIWGAGIRGNMILLLLKEAGIEIRGFVDGSVAKQGGYVGEYYIFAPDDMDDFENKEIIISPENYKPIETVLMEKGYRVNRDYHIITNTIYDEYVRQFMRRENIDYIAFGDCFFTEVDVDDIHGTTMGEELLGCLGKENSKILSIHGMCIPGFYHLMKEQIKLGVHPKSVAFIVNIPFCNSVQTKLPQSQHYELLCMIRDIARISSEEYLNYIELAKERSQNINGSMFSTKRTREHENVEKILTRTRYMYKFNKENENITYMKKLLQLLIDHHIKPVPFIPALNYGSGEKWFGNDFLEKYRAICAGIKQEAKTLGVDILDMSFLLNDEDYTGERMTKFPIESGRKKEMQYLAEEMKKWK